MRRIRVIPCLLIDNRKLVKTKQFKNPTYLGDPINAVKIFNDKEVDELLLLDITSTTTNREPNFDYIQEIVSESFMPIGYGGGIKNIQQIEKLFRLGVEKIVINNATMTQPQLIKEASNQFGSQSVVVSMDVKSNFFGKKTVFTKNGKENTGVTPVEYAQRAEQLGAGELYVTSIDKEGMRTGYDINLMQQISKSVQIPVVANGGAHSVSDFYDVTTQGGASAVSASSMFVYHGKLQGILINFPTQQTLKQDFWSKYS
jgi:imidazole glycerol-phosphate synthase subunit HisF